jgi:hypothetical protein
VSKPTTQVTWNGWSPPPHHGGGDVHAVRPRLALGDRYGGGFVLVLVAFAADAVDQHGVEQAGEFAALRRRRLRPVAAEREPRDRIDVGHTIDERLQPLLLVIVRGRGIHDRRELAAGLLHEAAGLRGIGGWRGKRDRGDEPHRGEHASRAADDAEG